MRRRPSLKDAALIAVVVASAAIGCGGSAKTADTPSTESADPLAELDRAEGEINALFGKVPAPADAAATAAPLSPPPVPQSSDSQPAAGVRAEERPASDACGVACRALASMARAAEHVCGLSGEEDARCGSARQRVKAASERVAAQCTC